VLGGCVVEEELGGNVVGEVLGDWDAGEEFEGYTVG
jgi:hypothetical protein